VVTFWLLSTSDYFMNYLNHLLVTINPSCLGLMNSKKMDCLILLKMGCTIVVDKGWPICFIFHKKETVSSLMFKCSLNLCMFYLRFFFVVSSSITWIEFSFSTRYFVNHSHIVPLMNLAYGLETISDSYVVCKKVTALLLFP